VQFQLVEAPGLRQRPRRRSAVHHHVSLTRRHHPRPRGALGDAGDAAGAAQGRVASATWWVRTKIGTPSWWSPCQRLADSKVRSVPSFGP
jgi:hypothetical protein